MSENEDVLTTEQRRLFNEIAVTTCQVWKHAPYVRQWYSDDINSLFEHLALNAMNIRFLFLGAYVQASRTIH